MRYAEVTFTPGPEVYRGPRETFLDGLTAGRERVRREQGVELRLRRLVDAGALVTINTDTPAIFSTTLTAEAELLRTAFGLSDGAAERVLQNAIDASFVSAEERAALTG